MELNNIKTEEDIKQYIKENWNKKSQRKMSAELHIGLRKLIRYAEEMGIHQKGVRRVVTQEEKDYIKKYYKKKGAAKISKELHLAESAVYRHANQLGLVKHRKKWTEEEEATLLDNYNAMPIPSIKLAMKKMYGVTRSTSAIKAKSKSMGIKSDITNNHEYLSSKEVGKLLGVAKGTISKYHLKGIITGVSVRNKLRFSIEDIKKFLKEHQERYNFKTVDIENLELLLIQECVKHNGRIIKFTSQEWYIEKKKKDLSSNKVKYKKIPWTLNEERILLKMLEDGINPYKAKEFKNRSYCSVSSKILELKKRNGGIKYGNR